MYATCIFCRGALGRNEALEHFPVGRRLAYDSAKGRLWVVCPVCERWNLTPLETRWEAIEEAERAYRATRLRLSTDNIGLAHLSEGLELVRVGAPPRLELAGWRYGDQFGRRRRKHIALGTVAMLVAATQIAGTLAGIAYATGGVVMLAGSGIGFAHTMVNLRTTLRDSRVPSILVRDKSGAPLRLALQDVRSATLVAVRELGGWHLSIQYRDLYPVHGVRALFGSYRVGSAVPRTAVFRDEAAHRALAAMLPHLNKAGGSVRRVREAVDVIGGSSSLGHLLYQASTFNKKSRKRHVGVHSDENNIAALPAPIRLSLEMVLHEEDERRAMEGELLELESRWREAEEIAAIADSLLVPPEVDERLGELHRRIDSER